MITPTRPITSIVTNTTMSEDDGQLDRIVDRLVGQAERDGHDPHRDERPDHEHVAMGEVDELDDPVDHRVAEGDERVDRAEGQEVLELLDAEHDVAE